MSSGLQCPQGLAGPQRATPISPSIKSRLCGILPDHIHLPLGNKKSPPTTEFPQGQGASPMTSVLLSTFLLSSLHLFYLEGHRFFGPAQRSLGPEHSLETRRGRAAPSHIVNSIVDQILAEKESSWWLSSLSSCEPAGILTLLVPASSFPHSSLFLQHLQLL